MAVSLPSEVVAALSPMIMLWSVTPPSTLFRTMASPVVFWIVPPVPREAAIVPRSPSCRLAPVPVTVRPPMEPVLLRLMPLGAPFAEMLWNVTSLTPMVVLATFSAVPVPERSY